VTTAPSRRSKYSQGNYALYGIRWVAIVQNADSSSLFDDLDAALQSASSEKRVAMLRQIPELLLGAADRLNDEQIGVFDARRPPCFWQIRGVGARSA
jgi:hypothetical protein